MPEAACERCGTFAVLRSNGFRAWCEKCWGSSASPLDRPLNTLRALLDAYVAMLRDFFVVGVGLAFILRIVPSVLLLLAGVPRSGLVLVFDIVSGTISETLLLSVVFERALRGRTTTDWTAVRHRTRARFGSVALTNVLANLLALAGLVACVLPGILATAVLSAAIPLALYEDAGPFHAIGESFRRGRSKVWTLVALTGPLLLATWGVSFALQWLGKSGSKADSNVALAIGIAERTLPVFVNLLNMLVPPVIWAATRPASQESSNGNVAGVAAPLN